MSLFQFKRRLSLLIGWAADRRIPGALRSPVYRTYARLTGAELADMRGHLRDHGSLGAFFVRRLKDGVRVIDADPGRMPSPVDSMVQAMSPVHEGAVIEAKGRNYPVRDLLAGVGEEIDLEGGHQFTLYLGPKDYHRIHSPLDATLFESKHVAGDRFSVQPKVLAKRRVLPINERVVLRLESEHGPFFMVLVGAIVVGRIRVVGLEPFHVGQVTPPRFFARGEELGRFEMGSTVVLVTPPGFLKPLDGVQEGDSIKLGQAIATLG
ncbi:Phosphatidylserine decarboxylase proenzyme [Planctomycetes bacterium Poly30]|uniref:phosphatidylserine decarboxylase n=1 Tax=Saltatorellus ferox TaxID=2528018 RepID=A0A518ER87_9BACT|nr:Phosphatidylserine decarboxylase proenzyme [Planctomycetes bacterium Poly30]